MKTKYNLTTQVKYNGTNPSHDFDPFELALFKEEDSEADSFLSAESDVEVRRMAYALNLTENLFFYIIHTYFIQGIKLQIKCKIYNTMKRKNREVSPILTIS